MMTDVACFCGCFYSFEGGVRDRVVAVGEPAHVIDEGQADLADERRWFHGPATVIAWGRRTPI